MDVQKTPKGIESAKCGKNEYSDRYLLSTNSNLTFCAYHKPQWLPFCIVSYRAHPGNELLKFSPVIHFGSSTIWIIEFTRLYSIYPEKFSYAVYPENFNSEDPKWRPKLRSNIFQYNILKYIRTHWNITLKSSLKITLKYYFNVMKLNAFTLIDLLL